MACKQFKCKLMLKKMFAYNLAHVFVGEHIEVLIELIDRILHFSDYRLFKKIKAFCKYFSLCSSFLFLT